MKKLMIALAAVAMAIGAQAAVANWGCVASNIFNGKGDSAAKVGTGTTVLVFDANILAQSTLFDTFANDTKQDLSKLNGYATTVATSAAGTMAAASVKFAYGEQSTDQTINSYSFYFAIVDGDNIYLSDSVAKNANKNETAVSVTFGNQAPTTGATSKSLPTDGFVSVGQWAAAVPEPTSGLLLLLGMAGLALKRKQA